MKPRDVTIRRGTASDVPFLRRMLYEAAYWRPDRPPSSVEEALEDSRLSRYIAGWGRPGDTAVVALDDEGQPIGAAWYRLFSPADPGYGFVNSSIPELSMAVVDEHRRHGVGRALIRALIGAAVSEGFTALSLSVEQDNRALALYESVGFDRLRLADNAWTMQVTLSVKPRDPETGHVTERGTAAPDEPKGSSRAG